MQPCEDTEVKDIKISDIKIKVKEDSDLINKIDGIQIKNDEQCEYLYLPIYKTLFIYSDYAYQLAVKEDIKSSQSALNQVS